MCMHAQHACKACSSTPALAATTIAAAAVVSALPPADPPPLHAQAARLESLRLRQLHPYTPAASRQGWPGKQPWAGYAQLMSPQVLTLQCIKACLCGHWDGWV
jgi:hypothetical protein